jgi:hypothetical protein
VAVELEEFNPDDKLRTLVDITLIEVCCEPDPEAALDRAAIEAMGVVSGGELAGSFGMAGTLPTMPPLLTAAVEDVGEDEDILGCNEACLGMLLLIRFAGTERRG